MRNNERRVILHLSYGGAITTFRLKGAQREGAVTAFSPGTRSPKVTLQGKSRETNSLTSLSSPVLTASRVPSPLLKLNWALEAREPVGLVPWSLSLAQSREGTEQPRGPEGRHTLRRHTLRRLCGTPTVVGNHVSGHALGFAHTSLATKGRI